MKDNPAKMTWIPNKAGATNKKENSSGSVIPVKKVVSAVLSAGGIAIITADHGNAEQMTEVDGSPFTAHTINNVPFIIAGMDNVQLAPTGRLADIAPTMLHIMGEDKPLEMTGKNLII